MKVDTWNTDLNPWEMMDDDQDMDDDMDEDMDHGKPEKEIKEMKEKKINEMK